MRTTLNIDDPILREVKKVAEEKGLPLGRVVSDLLADALHDAGPARSHRSGSTPFRFLTKRMGVLLDIDDTTAVLDAVDTADGKTRRASPTSRKRSET